MGLEKSPVGTMDGWMREIERRHSQQMRRRVPTGPADLLGPGFGPTATELNDWSSDEAAFNGFFWSAVGAINSPDSAEEWAGIAIAEEDGDAGIQKLWTPRDGDPPREYVRRWTINSLEARIYTPWRGNTGWQDDGITGVGTATIVSQHWSADQYGASITVHLRPGAVYSFNSAGEIGNVVMLQVPALVAPSATAANQGLGSGGLRPMLRWIIDSTGAVQLVGGPPSTTIGAGADLSVSGNYRL